MTLFLVFILYNEFGDYMQVKLFDYESEKDLEEAINDFIEEKEIIDIKYSTAIAISGEEQIYCFTAMIIYLEK